MMRTLLLLSIVGTLACGIDIDLDGGDDAASDPCGAMCLAQAAANCPGFSMQSCQRTCLGLYNAAPRCTDALDALTRCAAHSRYACTDGRPMADACHVEVVAASACMNGQPR
jgi:hypothetical protein